MSRFAQRPDNALKKANEFIEVGKPVRALDTLYEVFKNKKWAFNWSETVLEPIMFKYLELCVELKKSHIAKEGLFQYRNMFQSVNVGSLENVIRGYLRLAEKRTEAAREQSQQAVIDIDDLDNLETPESILLSAVSGEDAQDRSDRTILTPWVKFLWESYCQCLELLRTNAHVETLYHDIAKMAFNFCIKYNRKAECRKLCDKLRKHLEDIAKLQPSTVNVSLNKPETQQYNLETRLIQLDSAIQMELWQEAYKATEDIHNLMAMSKKSSVPKTMANYYQKLAMVFWKAGYYLFHAAALFKLFKLNKEMKKNITQEELQRMANLVLLATLSVPLPSAHPEFDRFIESDKTPLEKAQKLSVLLELTQPPTRQSLLKDIVRLNIISLASEQYQNLYNWLEVEFNPLELCTRVDSVISTLEDDQYTGPLRDVTLVKLILQVCQVYQTIKFDKLMELTNKFATPFQMERILVECVRHRDMQIRIDHGAGCIHFGIDLSESQREDKQEGPILQPMPSEQIRNQLINMSTVLTKSMQLINPSFRKKEKTVDHAYLIRIYHSTKEQEHQRILARHKIIEDRKEYIEKLNTEREVEEQRRQEELLRQQIIAEQERIEFERKEKERKRLENELAMMKERNLKEKVQQIAQTTHGQKILKKLDEEDMKNLDAEQITQRELEEYKKEMREQKQKLKSQEKKMDYYERAKRIEEIPLIEKFYQEKKIQDRKYWEEKEAKRIAQLIEERNLAVAHRERLKRIKDEKDYFLNKLITERLSTYESKLENFELRLVEERKKRLEKRKRDRKKQRFEAFIEAKEAEERKRREEERRIEDERKKKEEEEENKRRLERERERMESAAAAAASAPPPTPAPASAPASAPAPAPAPSAPSKYVPPRARAAASSAPPPRSDDPPPRRIDDGPRRTDDGPRRMEGGPRRMDDGPRRMDDGPRRMDDGPRRMDDGPRRMDDGPRRIDDGPRRMDDGPRKPWDGPRRNDDGPRRDDRDGPRRMDDGPRRNDDGPRKAWDAPRDRDGPRRMDDGPRRMDDGPRRMDDGPRRMDDGPRRMDDGPRRMDDGPRRSDDRPWRSGPGAGGPGGRFERGSNDNKDSWRPSGGTGGGGSSDSWRRRDDPPKN